MPIHDWTQVEAGIFHDFHHAWIEEIKRTLNSGILPGDYYALAEQHAVGFGPDVLTLEHEGDSPGPAGATTATGSGLLMAEPQTTFVGETDMEFYRRKQNTVSVRHVSGDRVVAMIEVVSPGNKSGRRAVESFVSKAAELLDHRIHLLILDVNPAGPRDPNGIHAVIWEEISGQEYFNRTGKPLTFASYEAEPAIRAFVEHVGIGDPLPEMPLFLQPRAFVNVPLNATYDSAFAAVPRRWQNVLLRSPNS